jgi:Outer membrane lipoprotein-sorting protein
MRWMIAIIAAATLIGATTAPDAALILRRAYDNYRSKGSTADVVLTIHRPAWERRMALTSWTRGQDDSLVRFTAPPKDAGTASLKLGNETWIYNPKLNQVIRLPASMLSQSWMGSDFSYGDLARSTDVIEHFTHRLIATRGAAGHTVWTIESLPRPNAPEVWGKVVVEVRDDNILLSEVFYDQGMHVVRTLRAERIGTVGGRSYPVVMTMTPADEAGRWTRVETVKARFDFAAPPWLFTLSNLQNPRS